MKLTKFQHACFTVEKDGSTVVVDPGVYSHDFIIPQYVTAIVITHEHPDHLDPALLVKIFAAHPKATLIAHESITAKYAQFSTVAIRTSDTIDCGGFTFNFFGGLHAPIAEGIITPPNFGVLVDSSLYYPGDSFTLPEGAVVKTLALPISAPWLDFARVRTFLDTIHPLFVFPTHDGILSEDGKTLAETMVGGFAQSKGIIYKRLDGQKIELI